MNYLRGLFGSPQNTPPRTQKRVGISNVSTVREFGYENRPFNVGYANTMTVPTQNQSNMERQKPRHIKKNNVRYNAENVLERKNQFKTAKNEVRKGINRFPRTYNENIAHGKALSLQNELLMNEALQGGGRRHTRRRRTHRKHTETKRHK